MIYNLSNILEIQKKLNDKIQTTQKINRETTKSQAHLCIMVELMELCNETRCFNYWSKKTRASDEVILEEFADVLCFLMTELIEIGIDKIEINDLIKPGTKFEINTCFIKLVELYGQLDYHNKNAYYDFTVKLYELGYLLGYNVVQIYDSYLKKVEKNYEVQDEFLK